MKYSFLKFLFILPFLLFPIKSFGVQADIQDISDNKYFQAVHEKLSGANGVLEIRRARIPKGAGYEDREPNQYLLGMLYSEKDMEEKWFGMEKLYGKDKVAKAREFSFMIDRGYSPKVVENFIRIMKEYNEDAVRKAVKKVSKMRPDNPLRNVGYIVGILRKEKF